ncbi:unnamed protein product [Closterium sp. NIES-65]|nr:unnamed protein product [Closterium sp. NIES-65]
MRLLVCSNVFPLRLFPSLYPSPSSSSTLKELWKSWAIDINIDGQCVPHNLSSLPLLAAVPPLKELSKVWGIDIVNGGDCADWYNTQVVRECDKEGFIVSITYVPLPAVPPLPPVPPVTMMLRCRCPASISLRHGFDTIPDVITNLTRLTSLLSPPSSHLPVSLSPPYEPLTSL